MSISLFDTSQESDPTRLSGRAQTSSSAGSDPDVGGGEISSEVERSTSSDTFTLVARVALLTLAVASFGLVLNLALGSRLEQSATQVKEMSAFRFALAAGTAPTGGGKSLANGTPVAELSIPSIGLRQVVDAGTDSAVLENGPGYLPSSVFPGGVGTSVIYGRASTYGGPFARIGDLKVGATITVKVQDQPNTAVYKVVDIRSNGQKVPKIGSAGARLTLATAKESMLIPSTMIYVDANIVGTPLSVGRSSVSTAADELPMGIDTSDLSALLLWVIALGLVMCGAVWVWETRGHFQAWIIFAGPVAIVSLLLANQIALLLPNVM